MFSNGSTQTAWLYKTYTVIHHPYADGSFRAPFTQECFYFQKVTHSDRNILKTIFQFPGHKCFCKTICKQHARPWRSSKVSMIHSLFTKWLCEPFLDWRRGSDAAATHTELWILQMLDCACAKNVWPTQSVNVPVPPFSKSSDFHLFTHENRRQKMNLKYIS